MPYTPGYVFPATTAVIPISGIPAGAVVNGVGVKLNITHTYVSDLVIVLQAPNGNIFNLDAAATTTGKQGLTLLIQLSVLQVLHNWALVPRQAIPAHLHQMQPALLLLLQALYSRAGLLALFQMLLHLTACIQHLTGNWTLAVYDYGSGDVGKITSWSVDITYGVASSGIWTPNAGLFLDAAATIPYNGTLANVVYAKPAASTNYSVTVNTGKL
ncbi:MAG: proprotein convertase P-domain-containing protein [Ferruginibacter sp.]